MAGPSRERITITTTVFPLRRMHAFQVPTHNNLQSFAMQYVFLTIMQGLFGSQLAVMVKPPS